MWKLKFTAESKKQLKKLNKDSQIRVIKYLQKVEKSNSPISFGKALTGNKRKLWRYRVGDYRVICYIKNKELVVLILEIEHRSKVYK